MASVSAQTQPALQKVTTPSRALALAIDEFRAQTGGLNGTMEMRGGGGTAAGQPAARPSVAWHGRIYENLRNDALDAIPHQIRQRGGEQRKLRRNQYGFAVSGPVVLPKMYNGAGKTFFTMSYEGMRESIGQFRQLTIPTTRERTGDWGHVVDSNGAPLIIYDPATTAANPNYNPALPVSTSNLQYLRQPFLSNTIPVTRLDPVAQQMLQYYPQPNLSVGPFFQNNYYSVTPEINRADGFILSIDHSFLQKHRITGRINNSNGLNGSAATFPTLANPASPPQKPTIRGARLEHVYTASPTNVNNFRAQLDVEEYAAQPLLDANGNPFPRVNFSGAYQNLGAQNPLNRTAFNSTFIVDTFATQWRTHRLSIGQEYHKYRTTSYQADFPAGRYDFTSGLTSLPGIINTGHPFASFLLGMASQGQLSVVTSPSYLRWSTYRTLFSDQWQVKRWLTITLGANLETFTQRIEKYDRQSTVSLDAINPANGRPGALVVANTNGFGRAFVPTWTHVEPSIGIAWSVLGDNRTVLRLNYDRRYGDARRNGDQFATQAFNGNPLWLSANTQLTPALLLQDGLQGGKTFPDLRPEAANDTRADYLDPSKRQPMAQNFNFSVQRELAPFLILTVTYNNQHARNQYVGNNAANPNALPLSALQYRDQLNDLNFNRAQRPYPQYQDFNVANMFPRGSHRNYNWAFDLEKRTNGGLAMTFHYNYFNRMDNYSSNVQDFYDLRSAWSRAAFANNHSANVTYIYELPFGAGKRFLSHGGALAYIAGGWAINGRSEFWSGQPLHLTSLFNNTGGVIGISNLYVDNVPGVNARVDDPSEERWFNPAAFSAPADFTPGNATRIHPFLNNPGGFNHDLTLNKRFAIDAARSLEFTASLFNATNHANLNSPDARIGTAKVPNINAGRIIGSSGGRIVQLGLRLNF
jgi:hypothetical protein